MYTIVKYRMMNTNAIEISHVGRCLSLCVTLLTNVTIRKRLKFIYFLLKVPIGLDTIRSNKNLAVYTKRPRKGTHTVYKVTKKKKQDKDGKRRMKSHYPGSRYLGLLVCKNRI